MVLQGTSRTAEGSPPTSEHDIRERLVKANPNVAETQADLAWTLHDMGEILADIHRSDDATTSPSSG